MLTERCVACGADVPMGDAVHMLVNPKGGEDVVDGYLCRECYEEHLEPLVGDDGEADADEGAPADASDGDATEGADDRTAEGA